MIRIVVLALLLAACVGATEPARVATCFLCSSSLRGRRGSNLAMKLPACHSGM